MFGALRIAKAKRACVSALRPMIHTPETFAPWPTQIWRDPYVLGFVVGAVAIISAVVTRNKLNSVQGGQVLIGTLKALGGYTHNTIEWIAEFGRNQDLEYKRGQENASKLALYMFGSGAFDGDPDIAGATAIAKGTTLGGPVDRAAIGGALMHLLFHMPVKQKFGS